MAWKKRARLEGDGVEGRTGITWRDRIYVVEMRLSKKVAANLKLHFGSYGTVEEAHVGRDYAAYLRNSTGQEDRAAVGGFRNPDVHPPIFKFEISPRVFESLEQLEGSGSRAQARCDEYKNLLELQTPEARKKFCEAAREDIGVAIESFRSRYPQMFPRPPLLNHLPNAEPGDGKIHRTPPPSSSEVRVSPTPGTEVGVSMEEGSISFSGALPLEVQIVVNGSPPEILRLPNAPFLTYEEILMIVEAGKDKMVRTYRELFDEWLEGLDPCSIDPETIPPLE